MPRDSRWRTVSVPADELEEWSQIARRDDSRLPDPFSNLDVIRSIVKLYKKSRRSSAVDLDGAVRSADGQSLQHGTVPAQIEQTAPKEERLTDRGLPFKPNDEHDHSAELDLLRERQKLEVAKANTFYWKARATGRARTAETTIPSRQVSEWGDRTLCKLCRLPVHSGMTCDEARSAARALGGSIAQ